jgi:hypothetical protein
MKMLTNPGYAPFVLFQSATADASHLIIPALRLSVTDDLVPEFGIFSIVVLGSLLFMICFASSKPGSVCTFFPNTNTTRGRPGAPWFEPEITESEI